MARALARTHALYPRKGRWRRTHWEADGGRETKLEVLRRYRFNLAFENCIDRDYVTEKWFDCLLAGCVPVYAGAPNIADFAPGPDSYVDALAFEPEALARHLPAAFTRLFEGQDKSFLHQLCAWLDAERAAARGGAGCEVPIA